MAFEQSIRKYRLSDLIKMSAMLSQRLWNNNEPIAKLTRLDSSRFINGVLRQSGSMCLTPWHLVDIVFYGIKLSSGDFGISRPSEHDFLTLYNEYLEYENDQSGIIYKDLPPKDALFYMLFGLGQKTFWFQERQKLHFANFRFYQMLYSLPKRHSDLPKYYSYIENRYGCTFEAYQIASMVLVWLAGNNNVINLPLKFEDSPRLKGVNNELVNALLQDYISEYDSVRRSSLEARALYLTPVLRSTEHELLVSSAFLLARKGFTNLYWESRRLCLAQDRMELNLSLGQAFERYVDELMERFLPKEKYRRLPPIEHRKRADLILFTNAFTIIIEQKFAMLNISQQDVHFDLKRVDSWLSAFVQAARQLDETAEEFRENGKPAVKLILFFDNLNIADGLIKDRVVEIAKATAEGPVSIENLFMISIDELERLLQILGKNEALVEKVIAEKINRQLNRDYTKGVEFDQVMDEMSAERNEYITSISPLKE
jgi:hypothetical protein